MDVLDMNDAQPAQPSARDLVVEMLGRMEPGADFSADERLFSRIIDDYAEHARFVAEAAEREREAELRGRNATLSQLMAAAPPATDGTPRLGGSAPATSRSIFDLARF